MCKIIWFVESRYMKDINKWPMAPMFDLNYYAALINKWRQIAWSIFNEKCVFPNTHSSKNLTESFNVKMYNVIQLLCP